MDCEMIVPVGTSMLSGWMRRLDPDLRFPRGWVVGGGAEVDPPNPQRWIPALTESMRQRGARTSAELDSIRLWLDAHPNAHVARVTLLVSDTDAARWVAQVTQALLPNVLRQQATIEQSQVPQLSPDSMRRGLVEFVRVSANAIKTCRNRGLLPIINATPGFKAEAALLTLEGALLGAESFYLHEQMQSIVTIPAIPLRWGLDESDLGLLRRIGGAATRDTVRALGLGKYPHLEPFVVCEGQGAEEVWGLSALGELLIESIGDLEVEQLPDRGAAPEIRCVERERPHMPVDAVQLAERVAAEFPFVTQAQIYGFWRIPHREGVLPPRENDIQERVVRLCLRSHNPGHSPYQSVSLRLYTTAETDAQYREAVRRLGARYGEITLKEYLIEQEIERAETLPEVAVESELAQLAIEELLKRALDRSQAECARLSQELASAHCKLEQLEQDVHQLDEKLEQSRRRARDLDANAKTQSARIAELEARLASASKATLPQGNVEPGGTSA